jgi:hypothetical protein
MFGIPNIVFGKIPYKKSFSESLAFFGKRGGLTAIPNYFFIVHVEYSQVYSYVCKNIVIY